MTTWYILKQAMMQKLQHISNMGDPHMIIFDCGTKLLEF